LNNFDIFLAFSKRLEQCAQMKAIQLKERMLLIESEVAIVRTFSAGFLNDLTQALDAALGRHGIVNVPLLAEQARRRNAHENIALEDVEAKVMQLAQRRSAIMEFETPAIDLETPLLPM
jgi:hypothetical protein